ncbi:hypothetical protein GIB67_020291 [Kingdonia uniflora]|uniref:Uncharacterized protein n=1 Tax=Kingdonia uniflora TaxID=39325 RepID=A0A7J7P3T2_9MAGN|nr:hypothetical protein GIB67_020291 [Kingdonia uniflora]
MSRGRPAMKKLTIPPDVATLTDRLDKLVEALGTRELYEFGCRNFLIPSLGVLGCSPIQIVVKWTCSEDQKADAHLYNFKLEKLLPQIQASLPGSKLIYVNLYDPAIDILSNPEKYGEQDIFHSLKF